MGKAIIITDLSFGLNLGTVTIGGETPPVSIPVTGINIANKPSSIQDGVQLSVTYMPTDTTQKGVSWKSSDETIATVSSSGYVTVKKIGSITITATSTYDNSIKDSFTATCSVTSTYVPVTSISPTGAATGKVGETIALSVIISPANSTNKGVTWRSLNENIATVNSSGIVNLLSAGDVTITATSVSETSIVGRHDITVSEASIVDPTQYPTDGLLVHLGSSHSDTIWNDLSGNGHNFTISGFDGTIDDGWDNEALAFKSDSAGKVINNTLLDGGLGGGTEDEVTVFVKVKLYDILGIKKLFFPCVDSGVNYNYALGTTADGIVGIAGGKNYKLSATMPVGSYFVAGLRLSGTRLRIYMNDTTFDVVDEVAVTRYNQLQKTALGHNLNKWGTASERVNGAIKEVLVYDRALSDEEVTTVVTLMGK